MIYLLTSDVKFSKIREEKIISILSLMTSKMAHIKSVNLGDLIFDVNGNIACVNEILSETDIKVCVLTCNNNKLNDSNIHSFR